MRKILILSMILVISLSAVVSCSSGVSQQEYDELNSELVEVRSQLASLQSELGEVETLKIQNTELMSQNDALASEIEAMKSKYDELSKQNGTLKGEFEDVQTKYQKLSLECQKPGATGAISEEPLPVVEEDVEQAIFALINQDRVANGLDELSWGINLHRVAQDNNVSMEKNQQLEYPKYGAYQDAFWVTGYTDTDVMAEAIFTIWQNTQNYKLKFLNAVTTYGAVAAYKSGEIFYISYIADIFR